MQNFTNLNEKKRVAIYCRVSTDEQVINGNGLEIQKDALLNYISINNEKYTLCERNIYIDEGKSGASNEKEERVALYKMFSDAQNGDFEVLLVWKVDRFFRKTLYLLEGVEALDKLGIGFISITQPFDTTNPFGKMGLQMMGIIAELERDLIRERTQAGILTSMKKGKWGRGNVPYGYTKNEDGFLEINEEESEIIKFIFELLVKEQTSLNEIIKRLNQRGVETSTAKGKLGRKRQENLKYDNFWHRTSVQRIATNELYTGVLIQNRYKKGRKDKIKIERPKNEWLKSECPAIISTEIFLEAQKQLEVNRRYSLRNKKEGVVYMLSTLLHDKETGYKYTGYLSRKNTKNYRLGMRGKTNTYIPPKGISGNKIESAVWDKLAKILNNPKLFLEELKRLKEKSTGRNIENEIMLLNKEKLKLENSIKNFFKLASNMDSESVEEIKTIITENRTKISNINNEIKELEKYILSEEMKIKQLKDLEMLSEELIGRLNELSYEEKTEICRLLIDRINLDGNEAEIIILVPNNGNDTYSEKEAIIDSVFSSDNKFITEIQKDLPDDFSSDKSLLCYYIGAGDGARTHNNLLGRQEL